jgi:3-oxoacyl-[acyl-carrier protein] reductase
VEPGELAGQTAVVTGAARGLGKAVATLVASRGATVFMADVDGDEVTASAAGLRRDGFDVLPSTTDVTDERALGRLRDAILDRTGRVDILINNAGGWRHAAIRDITDVDWDWTFAVNLKSVLLATRVFMDTMVRARYGRVVNVASNDAYVPKVKLAHYAAAKAGVISLTKSLAAELAPHQVLVNAVSPGAIATETAKAQAWLAERIPQIPLGRAAEPADTAEVIAFLASPRNRFMTGETVIVNGGMLMV